jgi:hypothetical protein
MYEYEINEILDQLLSRKDNRDDVTNLKFYLDSMQIALHEQQDLISILNSQLAAIVSDIDDFDE